MAKTYLYKDQQLTLTQLHAFAPKGLSKATLASRLGRGMTPEDAIASAAMSSTEAARKAMKTSLFNRRPIRAAR